MTFMKKEMIFCGVAFATFLLMNGVQTGRAQAAPQTAAPAKIATKDYAGTWNWMYHDKRFATMILEQKGDQITGSMTNGHIDVDGQGKITNAAAEKGSKPIVKSTMEKGRLILLARDGGDETEFAMTLTSPSTAELRFFGQGAPANAEAIRLEKVWSEPPVEK